MWFNSWEFFIFLPLVLGIYYALGFRYQNVFLVGASYFFYGWWDWRFLALIFASTVVDFACSRLMVYGHIFHKPVQMPKAPFRRKKYLIISLVVNLGLLGIFKYFNFFVDSFIAMGATVGLDFDTPILRLIPPVGISFYTFQTLSYTIDVYRGKHDPVGKFIDFSLFVCYFPQLVAGPIERASRLLPQLASKRSVNLDMIKSGVLLILIGLFKKIVIADTAGADVTRIYENPGAASSLLLYSGVLLFSLQIYGDFSGYSNMARGISRLFGIELMENFQAPYLSRNITEFWRRWHISLSQWLRDYLYISLGGNRKGKIRTLVNLMLTMLLGGLWHGASWTYVVWGGLHGVYLVIHRMISSLSVPRASSSVVFRFFTMVCGVVFTFHLVSVTWVFFRAESMSQSLVYFEGLLSFRGGLDIKSLALPVLLVVLLAPLEWIQYRKSEVTDLGSFPLPMRSMVYTMMLISIVMQSGNEIPFIYFQF